MLKKVLKGLASGLLAVWQPGFGVEALCIIIRVQKQTQLIFGGILGSWGLPAWMRLKLRFDR
jgi:hypothetical protein